MCPTGEIVCPDPQDDSLLACSYNRVCGLGPLHSIALYSQSSWSVVDNGIINTPTAPAHNSAANSGLFEASTSTASGSIKVSLSNSTTPDTPTLKLLGPSHVVLAQGSVYSPCAGGVVMGCDQGVIASLYTEGDMTHSVM